MRSTKTKKTVSKKKVDPKIYQAIRKAIDAKEETKQFTQSVGQDLGHSLVPARDYHYDYFRVLQGITRGTAGDEVVGNKIRIKGIKVDCLARGFPTSGASELRGKFALIRGLYQATSYSSAQLFKPPDNTTGITQSYNTLTRSWNTHNGVVRRVYSSKNIYCSKQYKIDPAIDISGNGTWQKSWYIDMKNELIHFSNSGNLEHVGHDLYFAWIISGIGIDASTQKVGELQFNYTVYYKDA